MIFFSGSDSNDDDDFDSRDKRPVRFVAAAHPFADLCSRDSDRDDERAIWLVAAHVVLCMLAVESGVAVSLIATRSSTCGASTS